MDKWLNQLFMLLKSPVGEAEIPDVKPPLSVVDSQELGFFFTYVFFGITECFEIVRERG
jgi:hypothetical protein